MQVSKGNTKASMLNHQRLVQSIQTIHKRKYINDKLEYLKKQQKLECLCKDKVSNMFI